jgi:hypothetical protein
MSNFCPEWLFSVCCVKTSDDFLRTNNSMNMVAKKFSTELSSRYSEVKFEEISYVAEQVLQFLSEINAGEEAVNFLNDYIFYRVNYTSSGSDRKIKSMFSSAFDGEKQKDYNSEKVLKLFKATTYSLRNGIAVKASPGWVIRDVEDIDWLADVFDQSPDFSDI